MLRGILAALMIVSAVFLILLVLVQRGRGGGLAGALGGMGGQSAFGTKAGDLFTRVTIGAAAVWIILCVISVKLIGGGSGQLASDLGGSASQVPDITRPVEGKESGTPGGAAAPGSTVPSGGPDASAKDAATGGAAAPGSPTAGASGAKVEPPAGESKTSK